MTTLKIFVSSPGDVGLERRIALRVIERLQGEFGQSVNLEPVLWEEEPMRATDHFQAQIIPPSETDIVVTILWSRLGTRLPSENFRREDGSQYDSGTEWEFEDALSSHKLRGFPDILVYQKTTRRQDIDIAVSDEELDELRSQWRKVQGFVDSWFRHPDGSFKAAFTAFSQADEFESKLETHLRKLIRERLPEHLTDEGTVETVTWHKGSPFLGLNSFEPEHAEVFFGRTRAIADLRDSLVRQAAAGCAFVLVFGMSGSGKSSLVRAGLLPTLTQPGVVEGVGLWRWAIYRPASAADLIEGLATALVSEKALPGLIDLGFDATELAALWREAPGRGVSPIRTVLEKEALQWAQTEQLQSPPAARLLLVIDQMEELFTREEVSDELRESFVQLISILARSGVVWIVATMRSDFYSHCTDLPELVVLKDGAGQYDLASPNFTELGQMIRYPARAAGLLFELDNRTGERLDDRLHEAAAGDPESLPLLEFTLEELFKQRRDNVLTISAYDDLGGLEGAIAQRAEAAFDDLPPESQAELPALLRALVTIGGDDTPTARPASLEIFANLPSRKQLVDALVDERLLTTSHTVDGKAVVRVAHEALFAHWPRAQTQLKEDLAFLATRARIEADTAAWMEKGREPSFLLPAGRRLVEAADLLANRREELNDDVATYIKTSVAADAKERKRKTRLWQAAFAGMFMLAIAALVGGFTARTQKGVALKAADELALGLAGKVEPNFNIPTNEKQFIAEHLDNSFGELVRDLESGGLWERYADLLASKAVILFDIGHYDPATESALRADKFLFSNKGEADSATSLVKARVKLVLALARQAEMSFTEAFRALDQADSYLEEISGAISNDEQDKVTVLRARLARTRAGLLNDAQRPDKAKRLEIEIRKTIIAALDELGKDGNNDWAQRALYTELFWLQTVRFSVYGNLDIGNPSEVADFQKGLLERAKPVFNNGNDPVWIFFNAHYYIYLAEAHGAIQQQAKSVDTITIAIDKLYTLVRNDKHNLSWRYFLARALIDRASYSSERNDYLQAEEDLKAARTLAVALKRDTANRYLSSILDVSIDDQEGLLHLEKFQPEEALKAFTRIITRSDIMKKRTREHVQLNDMVLKGHTGMALTYKWLDNFRKAAESVTRILETTNENERIVGSGPYLSSRRYLANTLLLKMGGNELSADHLERHFQNALKDVDAMIVAYPDDPTWQLHKGQLMEIKGRWLAVNGKRPEAVKYFDQAIKTALAALKLDSKNIAAVSTVIVYSRKKLEAQAAVGDWQGVVESARQVREVILKNSESAHTADELWDELWGEYFRFQIKLVNVINQANTQTRESPAVKTLEELEREVTLAGEMADHIGKPTIVARAGGQKADSRGYEPIDLTQFDLSQYYAGGRNVLKVKQRLGWDSPPVFTAQWRTLSGKEFDHAANVFAKAIPHMFGEYMPNNRIQRVRKTILPFYKNGAVLDAEYRDYSGDLFAISTLVIDDEYYKLNGTSTPIHEANKKTPIRLANAAQAESYLRFFNAYVANKGGNFHFVENQEDFEWSLHVPMDVRLDVDRVVRPLVVQRSNEKGWPWRATGTILNSNSLFHVNERISNKGMIEMTEDEAVAKCLPVDSPTFSRGELRRIVKPIHRLDLSIIYDMCNSTEAEALVELGEPENNQDTKRPNHYLDLADEAAALQQAVDKVSGMQKKTFNKTVDILGRVVKLYVDAGKYETAYRYQDAVVTRWRTHMEKTETDHEDYADLKKRQNVLIISLAEIALMKGDAQKALSIVEPYAEEDAQIVLANAHIALGRPEKALAIYRENTTTKIRAEFWLDLVEEVLGKMESVGKYHKQVKDFRKLLHENPLAIPKNDKKTSRSTPIIDKQKLSELTIIMEVLAS